MLQDTFAPFMRQTRCSLLNAWENTQVTREMTSVFLRNTLSHHGRSRGETKYRHQLIRWQAANSGAHTDIAVTFCLGQSLLTWFSIMLGLWWGGNCIMEAEIGRRRKDQREKCAMLLRVYTFNQFHTCPVSSSKLLSRLYINFYYILWTSIFSLCCSETLEHFTISY